MQAQFNVAMMHLAGKGTQRSCKPALTNLKALVEKGPQAAALQEAHEAFFRGHHNQVGGTRGWGAGWCTALFARWHHRRRLQRRVVLTYVCGRQTLLAADRLFAAQVPACAVAMSTLGRWRQQPAAH